jgi:hypothetical protein
VDALKIKKILPRLGSDAPGEVIATVEALRRALAADGLDFYDLAELLTFDSEPEAVEIMPPETAGDWTELLDRLIDAKLWANQWEEEFLFNVRDWTRSGRRPSFKQQDKIIDIAERMVQV